VNGRCVRLGRTLDTKPNTGVIRSTFVVDEQGLCHIVDANGQKVKMLKRIREVQYTAS
jgi:peroxiredoxin